MKKNVHLSNRGFLLMETLLVSLTIAGVLVYIFVQYSSIGNSYTRLYRYNTVNDIYQVDAMKRYLVANAPTTFYQELDAGKVENLTSEALGSLWNSLLSDLGVTGFYMVKVTDDMTSEKFTELKEKIITLDSSFRPFMNTVSLPKKKEDDGGTLYQIFVKYGTDPALTRFASASFQLKEGA